MKFVLDTNTCVYALKPFAVLPFDQAAAEAYAESRLVLARTGRPICERDLQIASIAVARRLTVVTHDVSELARVPGLKRRRPGLRRPGRRPALR